MPKPHTTTRPEDRFSIRALHVVNTLFGRAYHDLTVLTASTIPRDGPAIVVCNHISPIDPVLVQSAATYRLVTWMMAKEYMALPVLGRVFRILDVIPVDRGSRETGPLRMALRRLAEGRIIGIFPEGKISTINDLLEFQTGVALMAIRAKVPVIPVYLDGTQRNKEMVPALLERSSSVVTFGPPVDFDRSNTSVANLQAATKKIRDALCLLRLDVDEFRKLR